MPNPQHAEPAGSYVGWSQGDREELGILRTRISAVEKGISDIASGLSALSSKFDKKSEIPWQALGVMLAFAFGIGGALYLPIRETQSELKTATLEMAKAIGSLPEKFVTIREVDARSARSREELVQIKTDINALQAIVVPRAEQLERWRSYENQDANLQRQIEDIKKAFGETFSLRDALQQMQRRIDMLETRRTP